MLQIVTRATTVISPGLSVTKEAIIPIVTITMLIHTMLFSIRVTTTLSIILTSIFQVTMQRATTIATITAA